METTELTQNSFAPSLTRPSRLTRTQAEAMLTQWQAGALSLAAFARERGVDVKRLYSWRQRLQQCPLREPSTGATGLAQVQVIDHQSSAVVVTVPNGIRIEIPADWSGPAIAALCGALSC